MNGYDRLKQIKQDLRVQGIKKNMTDLIVMGQSNDPYYIGSPAQVRDAKWFAIIWSQWNTTTSHIRRIHYRLVSQEESYLMPDGKRYENTINCWTFLGLTSKHARILEMVDPDQFVDRRNDPTVINLDPDMWQQVPSAGLDDDTGYLRLPYFNIGLSCSLSLPGVSVGGYGYDHSDQPYYLLLIIEKTTMDDVLVPICKQYGVNYLAGAGFTSITRVRDELLMMQTFGKPVRVFYISDFDPAGDSMPRAVSRQTEYWLKDFDVAGIKVNHLGLTRQQCIDYKLPRTPIKDTDRRKARWEDRHGDGATELDALEALYPGELSRIVTEAISPYRDMELDSKLRQSRNESIESVNEAWHELTRDQQSEINQVMDDAMEILKPYQGMVKEINQLLQPLRDRLETVSHEVEEIATQLDDYLTPRPEPETTPPDESGWLFDSDRDYLEQLEHYKAHKAGEA